MSGSKLLLVVATLGAASGCIGTTATPAAQGKAFVVKGNVFGTDTYNCDVVGGKPICWRVFEEEQASK